MPNIDSIDVYNHINTNILASLVSMQIDTPMVSEIVLSDELSVAQAIGIIGTLALGFQECRGRFDRGISSC